MEKLHEAIIIKDYNLFRYKLDKIDFPIEQRFRNGYFNVKVYSTQLELFLKENKIDHSLVEDVYEHFKDK
jgi:hypothetical protein